MFKVAIAQLDPVVGAFEANFQKIKEAYLRACSLRARVLLTPELGICGYPPYDLIDRPEMFERTEKVLAQLMQLTQNQDCALVVGHVTKNPSSIGRSAQNCVSVLEKGRLVFRQAKMLLPTYDIFDESRYFEPASDIQLWSCDGIPMGIAICEDLWGDEVIDGRHLYAQNPLEKYQTLGAQMLLVVAASPYRLGKIKRRETLHQGVAKQLKIPVVYTNQVGATDEVLFDGSSFAMNREGHCVGRLAVFQPDFGCVNLLSSGELEWAAAEWVAPSQKLAESPRLSDWAILEKGLIIGIQDYFARTGFKKALLGLSGGIDSAVVAYLAVRALGAENVCGIAMPSQYSSTQSLADAEALAKNLGMAFEVRPIKFLFSMAAREIAEGSQESLADVALENLQARLRGMILMTLSNHRSALVLTTGNKSEYAMGYCTSYGDMVGALAPIGDLYKTQVYEFARQINARGNLLIPESTLTRAPTAELKANQTDQDTLPPYDLLDAVLEHYLEQNMSVESLEKEFSQRLAAAAQGSGSAVGTRLGSVRDILHRLDLNEYKRRQAAPVLKVSAKAFGMGRRVPVAKVW